MMQMLRLRTIVAIGLLLGCTPLPPAPTYTPGDGSPPQDSPESGLLDAPSTPDVAVDGDAPTALDGEAPDGPAPDAPPPGAARLTGAFVSSGSSSTRLSGGFVWHGGSSRLSGWLQ